MITQDDLQGHWQRDWIKAPGVEDHTTRVHWLQAGALYADLRVPAERPETPGACLAEATPEGLLDLMEAEAFAGAITVEASVCTWARDVNWHGQPEAIDAGAMHFEDGALIETGVHAEYAERWLHKGAGLTARRVQTLTHSGVLVEDAARFLLVLGVPGAEATRTLIEALKSGQIPEACAAHFEQPVAFGHWQDALGIADLALNPFAEETAVLTRNGDGLTVRWPGFAGGSLIQTLQPA